MGFEDVVYNGVCGGEINSNNQTPEWHRDRRTFQPLIRSSLRSLAVSPPKTVKRKTPFRNSVEKPSADLPTTRPTGSAQHSVEGGFTDIFSGYIMDDKLYFQDAFNSEEEWNFEKEGVFSFPDSYFYAYGLEHHGATDRSAAWSGYFELLTGTTEQLGIMNEYGFYIRKWWYHRW